MRDRHDPVLVALIFAVKLGYYREKLDLERQLLFVGSDVFADLGGENLTVQGRVILGKVIHVKAQHDDQIVGGTRSEAVNVVVMYYMYIVLRHL